MSKKNIERLFNVVGRALFRTDTTLDYPRTIEAITRLADVIVETDTDEAVWHLGECLDATLGDILIGAYWFCEANSGDQWSAEYLCSCALGRIVTPGQGETGPDPESNAQYVYESLEALNKFAG